MTILSAVATFFYKNSVNNAALTEADYQRRWWDTEVKDLNIAIEDQADRYDDLMAEYEVTSDFSFLREAKQIASTAPDLEGLLDDAENQFQLWNNEYHRLNS